MRVSEECGVIPRLESRVRREKNYTAVQVETRLQGVVQGGGFWYTLVSYSYL